MSKTISPVSISFACRDNAGNFTGVPSNIEIGDDLLLIENRWWSPRSPKIDVQITKVEKEGGFGASKVVGFIKISRKKFDILGYKACWGNLIWDLIIVDIETAREIILYIHSLGCFGFAEGATNWVDKFDAPDFEWTDEETDDLKMFGYQKP